MKTKMIIIAVVLLVLSSTIAFAADDCVVPQFNQQQHVYISAILQNDKQLMAQLGGLAPELVEAGKSHEIVPYFVACQMNYQEGVPGVEFVHDVFEKWQDDKTFPAQAKVVVIAWVRNGLDTSHGSIGANAGQSLEALGLDADRFASQDGPILRDVRTYMPSNPKGEFVNIVRLMGKWIDEEPRRRAEQERVIKELALFLIATFGLSLGGLLCGYLMRSYKAWKHARTTTADNDRAISARLGEAERTGPILAARGVRYKYQTPVNSLQERQNKMRQQAWWHPLDTAATSTSLLADAEQLCNAIARSLDLTSKTIPNLDRLVSQMRASAARQREKEVDYAFPGKATPADLTLLFQLIEEGGNPDVVIALAVDEIASAKRCLDAGEVDDAEGQCKAAQQHLDKAGAIITDTLAAKAKVEEVVPGLSEMIIKLRAACEAAADPLAQLGSEFAPVNYADVENNIQLALATAGGVDDAVAAMAECYFGQRFLAAQTRLNKLVEEMTTAETGVVAIGRKLDELNEKRIAILYGLDRLAERVNAVGAKLETHSSARSDTEQQYAQVQQSHAELVQAVGRQGTGTNWIAAYLLWQEVHSGADCVSHAIDSDYSYHHSGSMSATGRSSSDTSSTFTIGSGAGGGNY